jgi:hypothetical protein
VTVIRIGNYPRQQQITNLTTRLANLHKHSTPSTTSQSLRGRIFEMQAEGLVLIGVYHGDAIV